MHESESQSAIVERTLRDVRALGRRHTRESKGSFWIEGVRPFVQAFDADYRFRTVIVSPVLLKVPIAELITRRLRARGVPVIRVSPEQFRSISTAERASGIGAVLQTRWVTLNQLFASEGICWLVVEEIRSAGNLGTLLRTAEACGASGVIFVGSRCDPFDPSVIRATMGGLFHLPFARATHRQLETYLKERRVPLFGLTPEADALWIAVPGQQPLALAIGEERRGLSDEMRRLCCRYFRLPMTGRADSLNVATAAGVMMFELVRQRLRSASESEATPPCYRSVP